MMIDAFLGNKYQNLKKIFFLFFLVPCLAGAWSADCADEVTELNKQITLPKKGFPAVQSNRTFCNDGKVLIRTVLHGSH